MHCTGFVILLQDPPSGASLPDLEMRAVLHIHHTFSLGTRSPSQFGSLCWASHDIKDTTALTVTWTWSAENGHNWEIEIRESGSDLWSEGRACESVRGGVTSARI